MCRSWTRLPRECEKARMDEIRVKTPEPDSRRESLTGRYFLRDAQRPIGHDPVIDPRAAFMIASRIIL